MVFGHFIVSAIFVPSKINDVSPHHQPIWLLDSFYSQNNQKNSPGSWLLFSGDIPLLVSKCLTLSLLVVSGYKTNPQAQH